jgi:hypothetical protein
MCRAEALMPLYSRQQKIAACSAPCDKFVDCDIANDSFPVQ